MFLQILWGKILLYPNNNPMDSQAINIPFPFSALAFI